MIDVPFHVKRWPSGLGHSGLGGLVAYRHSGLGGLGGLGGLPT